MSKWIIDAQHSDVHFKTRYLLISHVSGEFRKFEGAVEANGDDFSNAKITFSADTDSIDTNNTVRDTHLREEDFFAVKKFPKMTFASTGFYPSPSGNGEYILKGDLTIKTGTKAVELKVIPGGKGIDTQGKQRAGFEISGKINRYDFGLVWSLLSEAGAIILHEEVHIIGNIQIVKLSE